MMNAERRQWLKEQLGEFSECHLMNFGDSQGWDVHGDLCDLLVQNAALLEALEDARGAIDSLEDDALGRTEVKGRYSWPIKAELLSKIDRAMGMCPYTKWADANEEKWSAAEEAIRKATE